MVFFLGGGSASCGSTVALRKMNAMGAWFIADVAHQYLYFGHWTACICSGIRRERLLWDTRARTHRSEPRVSTVTRCTGYFCSEDAGCEVQYLETYSSLFWVACSVKLVLYPLWIDVLILHISVQQVKVTYKVCQKCPLKMPQWCAVRLLLCGVLIQKGI